jgi:hypothetical protein
VGFCKKREQASLTSDLQVFTVRRYFNTVNAFASQSIGCAENLNWTYEIEFVDRRHSEDDHVTDRRRARPLQTAVSVGHD